VWETIRKPQYVALLIVGVLAAVGCIFAGVWQIHRYDWKHGTNDTLRHDDHVAPVPVGRLLSTTTQAGKDVQFRRVSARGRYDVAGQLLVRDREINSSPAFIVLTPLRTDEGPLLLVARGWVAVTGSGIAPPAVPAPPAGEVEVTARVYPSEPAGSHDAAPRGQLKRITVPAIARLLGAPTYGGYVELISQAPSSALQLLPAPDLSNPAGGAYEAQHLAYVGQWFIFAVIVLAAPFLLARIEQRRLTEPVRDIAAPQLPSNHSSSSA